MSSSTSERFQSFDEFWPYYVGEHASPATRWMHFAGTASALLCLTAFAKTRRWWLLPAALVAGYGPAWVSHFFIEKNRPATFKYPLWSLLADFKMFDLMRRGAMDAEIERIKSAPPPAKTNGHGADDVVGVRVPAGAGGMSN